MGNCEDCRYFGMTQVYSNENPYSDEKVQSMGCELTKRRKSPNDSCGDFQEI